MMNSTECRAANETKHKRTASDYVGAVVNVNYQCQGRVVDWEYQKRKQRAYGGASVVWFLVAFFF